MPNANKPKMNNAARARMAARRKMINNAIKKNNSLLAKLNLFAKRVGR